MTEAPVEIPLEPAKPRKAHWFTPASAKAYAIKSAEVRKERVQQRKLAKLQSKHPELVQPLPAQAITQDAFVTERLMRTRKQITMLDKLLESETDPAKLDRLASAIEKLSRIEQNLAGRPGPGQYRPQTKPISGSKSIPEPL